MICASENRSFETALDLLPAAEKHARNVLSRVQAVRPLPPGAAILDIGAAQGLFVIACSKMGYRAVGIEPWDQARRIATRMASDRGITISMLDGVAESMPVESETFDMVHAMSVVEHVDSVEAAFREAYRALRPGGVFWFSTASVMCPVQNEIRGFPAFSWYPGALKLKIMNWALEKRPELIAHTTRPAYHWFTPWKARRLLHAAGFAKVLDRWDLRLACEGGRAYRTALSVVRANAATKIVADVFVPTCSYAAFK